MILPNCKCGCGEKVGKFRNSFVRWHNRKGRKHTEESKLKLKRRIKK